MTSKRMIAAMFALALAGCDTNETWPAAMASQSQTSKDGTMTTITSNQFDNPIIVKVCDRGRAIYFNDVHGDIAIMPSAPECS